MNENIKTALILLGMLLLLPLWPIILTWIVIEDIFFLPSSPPGIDNRMNDPLWVLYNENGEVIRGNVRSRGTDSDGSGMS